MLVPKAPICPHRGAYKIDNSLMVDSVSTQYLSRTFGTPTDNKKWTWSGWIKRGILPAAKSIILNRSIDANNDFKISFDSDNTIFVSDVVAGANAMLVATSQVFRDTAAWLHLCVVVDTNNAVAADRQCIFINGVRAAIKAGSVNYALGASCTLNVAAIHDQCRGYDASTTSYKYFDGYLANVHFIDGQALTSDYFGQTSSVNGQWIPRAYTGTYGANGFFLKFDNGVSLGTDSAGSNHWTPTNITSVNQYLDTPTNNFCTLNYLVQADSAPNITFSLGNTCVSHPNIAEQSNVDCITVATLPRNLYFEMTVLAPNAASGFVKFDVTNGSGIQVVLTCLTASTTLNATGGTPASQTGLAAAVANDVFSVKIDTTAGTVQVYRNGAVLGTQITGLVFTNSLPLLQTSSIAYDGKMQFNWGQRAFAYPLLSVGCYPICTDRLNKPAVFKGSSAFAAITYQGNGTTQTINAGFMPDLVWIKNRTVADVHTIYDITRGATISLRTDSNLADVTRSTALTAFTASGFSVGADTTANQTGQNFIAWCWKRNVINGFDIVSYTGTGVAKTINHSLSSIPKMIFIKGRNTTVDENWIVYHTSLGNAQHVNLNATTAQSASTNFNSTTPTTSAFSIGTGTAVNENTKSYIAYVWSEVPGFSNFGSYTGNLNANGPFVYTGFKPRLVMIKRVDVAGSWELIDTSRGANGGQYLIAAESSAIESAASDMVDVLSNGFKIKTGADALFNASGGTYIYAAFADVPVGGGFCIPEATAK